MTKLNPQSLREILRNFNKTQEDFARDLGVCVTTVNRWINGHIKPSRMANKLILDQLETYRLDAEDEAEASQLPRAKIL